jgi:hypothetical protein
MDGSSTTTRRSQPRANAPIRWPHPGWPVLSLIGIWVLGLLLAVGVPALIVSPGAQHAPNADVFLAFGCTLAGALVMTGVGLAFLRRHEDPVATAFGIVPAIAVTVCGLIMMATKLPG